MSDFPPVNFIPVPSQIEGIEVFAPRPDDDGQSKTPDVVSFECPQCGATTAFSLTDGGLKCAHCGYFEPPAREIVGKGAEDFEFKVETIEESARGWGVARKDLSCSSCGALTSLPVSVLSANCPFCGSNKVLQRDGSQNALRPRFLVPFKIDQENSRVIFRKWLGSSWLVPKQLRASSADHRFMPLYLPYWTFDASTFAHWRANVGYDRTVRYYDPGSKTWKSKTVTDWRWEQGNVQQAYDDLMIAGTKKISALHLRRIQNFDLRELILYSPEYLAGIGANSYDLPLDDAWKMGRHSIREDVQDLCYKRIKGDHVRGFEMAMDLSDESWRYILLPVFVSAFHYRNKIYRVLLNGQTGQIAGQRPVDWPKVWITNALMLLPGILISLIAYIQSYRSANAQLAIWIGLVIFVLGLVGMGIVLAQASAMDDI